MIVCDRCKKPARLFVYGDMVNNDYECSDLCSACVDYLRNLIWHYKNGDEVFIDEK